MGIQSAMGRSLDVAANFIFKLHIAVLESLDALPDHQRRNIYLYPVMDGVYFVTNDQPALSGSCGECSADWQESSSKPSK